LTDPVGFGAVVTPITADNRTPNLVNNLDLKIIDGKGILSMEVRSYSTL
jgi:hypothetical protein